MVAICSNGGRALGTGLDYEVREALLGLMPIWTFVKRKIASERLGMPRAGFRDLGGSLRPYQNMGTCEEKNEPWALGLSNEMCGSHGRDQV